MSTFFQKLKELVRRYSHAWVLLYGFIYLPWFAWLEKNVTSDFFVIHTLFDDYIPFIEFFIVPYLLWFFFVAITMVYFFLTDKHGFYRLTALLFTGMTIFLIICTVFPNGLNLRPTYFERDNIFVDLVRALYITDTPTNVLPSLHVYNSVGCYIAIYKSEKLQQYKFIQIGAFILTVSIVLSTMFLKQHSVVDVIAALVMAYLIYCPIYEPERQKAPEWAQQAI